MSDTNQVGGRGKFKGRGRSGPMNQQAAPLVKKTTENKLPEEKSEASKFQQVQFEDAPEQVQPSTSQSVSSKAAAQETKNESVEKKSEFMISSLISESVQSQGSNELVNLQQLKFPCKPAKRFSLGTDLKIAVNHFAMSLKKPLTFYQYHVDIYGSKSKILESKSIGELMLKQIFAKFPDYKTKIIYDFRKTLFSTFEFKSNPFEFEVLDDKNRKLKVIFSKDDTKSFSKIINPNTSLSVLNENDIEKIRILQMLMTQNLKFNEIYINLSNKFFDTREEKKSIGLNVDLWKGLFISVRPSELGLSLNVNLTSNAFNKEGKLLDLLCDYFKCVPPNLSFQLNNMRKRDNLEFYLRGLLIKDHLGYKKKIKSLSRSNSKQHKFENDGKKVSVYDYFREKYSITLQFPELPLLEFGKEKLLPIEVCYSVTSKKSNLTTDEQSNMIRATAVPCSERKKFIMRSLQNLKLNEDPILREFGINLDMKMISFNAKKISGAIIDYGKNQVVDPKNNGRWDSIRKTFYAAKSTSNWILINFSDLDSRIVNSFIQDFKKVARNHSIKIENELKIINENPDISDNELHNLIDVQMKHNKLEFLMVILQYNNKRIYNLIKTIGDIKYGLVTQCIDEKIIRNSKSFGPLSSNVCLKVNCKLGGTNFIISPQDPNFKKYFKNMYQQELMIFGVDVNHSAPVSIQSSSSNTSEEICESIAAVVGSIDKECCYYPARLLSQVQKKKYALETVYDLRKPVKELLNEYYKKNGKFPQRLIFFRDGVSEGQFRKVRDHEMNEIRRACSEISDSYRPPVTFVVVQKRHHTRFFPLDENESVGKCGNVPPGTVVDTLIVTPEMFDYFVCSHLGIQGTSKPCHYFCLHDENGFDSDKLILLSFYLCHIYSRSTTSVSYPAPTYYADLCAERGRQYNIQRDYSQGLIHENQISQPIEVNDKFKDKMFYI